MRTSVVEPTDIPGALVDHLAEAHDGERLERVRLLERSDLELVAMRLLELLDQPRDNVSIEARAEAAVTTGDLTACLKDIPDDLPVELGVIVDGVWRTAFLLNVEHVFDADLNREVCELLANDEPPRKWTVDTEARDAP